MERDSIENLLDFIYRVIVDFKPDYVAIDSITAMLSSFSREQVRSFLHTNLGLFVKRMNSTVFLISEKPISEEGLGFGVEEFVVDGVIILRYLKEEEHYRRVMEILKMRGRNIKKPFYEFTITEKGFKIIDIPELVRDGESVTERISTGIEKLDEITGGGFYRGNIIAVIGSTGTGNPPSACTSATQTLLRERSHFMLLSRKAGEILSGR